MEPLYTAQATAFGATTERVQSAGFDLPMSLPTELGGSGGDGTNPEQLIAAGYASCFQMALGIVGKRMDVSFAPDMQVQAQVDLLENGEAYDFRITLSVRDSGMDAAQLQPVLEAARQVCPMTRATVGAELQVLADQ